MREGGGRARERVGRESKEEEEKTDSLPPLSSIPPLGNKHTSARNKADVTQARDKCPGRAKAPQALNRVPVQDAADDLDVLCCGSLHG